MRTPVSTYRLQIRPGFTLQDAAETVPYLKSLGVDWVYLSPILTAEKGSDHGYDVTDPAAIERVLDGMVADWGGIDDLVNNAGAWDHAPLLDLTLERWKRIFDINLWAPLEISNAAVRRMERGSAIVNVASVMGQISAPTRGPYCVSKSALISLTKMQAIEWAERGIRVNAIAPGYIMNEPTAALIAAGSFSTEVINRRTPMGRFGTEQEAAEGIAFLLAPEKASYVTGHTLEVNGGWNAYGYV
jgi:NAD(P)-dependent dehydrogenase (short-subunit alcohol dehydrogenase family)